MKRMAPSRDRILYNARFWPSVDEPVTEGVRLVIRDGLLVSCEPDRSGLGGDLDLRGSLVMPGFVQSHLHCCQTLFRGLAEDLPLLPWLRTRIWPLEAAHTPESLRLSALLTMAELIRGGTTSFQSMETVHHTGVVFDAADEAGLAGVIGHCIMDDAQSCPDLAVDTESALDTCEHLLEAWGGHPLLGLGIAPRFALACSETALREVAVYARSRALRLHTHASEQREEVEAVRARTGRLNIHYLHDLGLTGPDVGLAHCVHTEPSERALLRDTGTRVLHCPSANLKLGSGVAPVPEYLAEGMAVSLGADGAPCNNRLDMFTEMRTAALIQQLKRGPGTLPAREVVRMATEGGARALGQDAAPGRLAPGLRADLIAVRLDGLHVLPDPDPANALVYACRADDVCLTMVNGNILFHDGVFTTLDVERIRREARPAARQLAARARLA